MLQSVADQETKSTSSEFQANTKSSLLSVRENFDTKSCVRVIAISTFLGYAVWIRGQSSLQGESWFQCIFQILHSKEYLLTWNGEFESYQRVARGFRAKTSGAAEFCVHTKKAIKGKKHPVERQKWRELYIGREIKTAHVVERRENRGNSLSFLLFLTEFHYSLPDEKHINYHPSPPAASAVPDGVIFNELGEEKKGAIQTPS